LAEKRWSSVELVEAALNEAEKSSEGAKAFVGLFAERARSQAVESDARRAQGEPKSDFDGVPFAVKDNMCVAGERLSCASAILRNYRAPYSAGAIRRLEDAGMIPTGRTNMDEFAMGSSTENSVYGPTRNPWNREMIPGGSSGGSAAAVAEGSAIVALGSDTGGSIRQPAAMCGVVGLKPTYGRVSRYGLVAMASSFDQIGPLAKTTADAAALLGLIEGHDPNDSTSVPLREESRLSEAIGAEIKGLRIGLPAECFGEGLDGQVEETVRSAVEKLVQLGAEVREISLPRMTTAALAAYYVIMPSEVSANLSRIDGVRYGAREDGESLSEVYGKSRGRGFGAEVRRRVMIGTYALSSGYYDDYYVKALKVRRLIARDYERAFKDVDVIVTPTSPTTAWRIGERVDDPLANYMADIYTVGVNVAGLPGINVPCGLADGLPVGLQIIGRHFEEKVILRAANALEGEVGRLKK